MGAVRWRRRPTGPGESLVDEEREQTFDYTYKSEVIHSEILLPEPAPKWMHDRQKLWNAVEAREQRQDAQVAREIEFALPQELSQAEAIGLARDYVRAEFVERGMVADLNIHWEPDNPHAHVMLTMREVTSEGFRAEGARVERRSGCCANGASTGPIAPISGCTSWASISASIIAAIVTRASSSSRPAIWGGRSTRCAQRGEYAERARELEEVRERNAQQDRATARTGA